MADSDRRAAILEAALTSFLEKGFAATTIADIRRLSGATTGSIYHFFKGKEAIATALFLGAVEGWSAATAKAAASDAGAEATIRSSVEGLVDWGLSHPRQFRIMDEMRFLEPLIRRSPDMASALSAGAETGEATYATGVAAGALRPLPWPIARAAILGPAYDFLRMAHAGRARLKPAEARRYLSDLAWASVSTS